MLPGLREWVFSAKTFASSMAALYIALLLDLDRPYWAMMTVYVVAQPLTGAMRSKSVFRFAGTLLGAIAAIALVPNLVAAPAIVGWLSDTFRDDFSADAQSLRWSLLLLAPTGFWAAWHLWTSGRTIAADQMRASVVGEAIQ